jgi:hypothetical protein
LSQTGKPHSGEGEIKRPSHTTVVAYAALVLAVGTGGAYAVDKVTSGDIRDDSVRSRDLRDAKAVKGRDVARNALGGTQIDEQTLDAGQFLSLSGSSDSPSCHPTSTELIPCVKVNVEVARPSQVLVVATGEQFTNDGDTNGSGGNCQLRIDGADLGSSFSPGESDSSTHEGVSTNGFARTLVTPDPLTSGSHEIELACSEVLPDYWIGSPTLAVLAISTG